MCRDFYKHYGGLRGITPAVMRSMYVELTGDTTESSATWLIDQLMHLYILGELPQTEINMRHMNSGCTAVYDLFFCKAKKVINDWIAKDDRRHSVAHLSKFISVCDLYENVKSRCSSEILIPSEEWLRLQFLPTDPTSSSAVHYTGCLNVKFAVQSRILCNEHEDDHYAACVFKYMQEMAVELWQLDPIFVCMDDKVKIPIMSLDVPPLQMSAIVCPWLCNTISLLQWIMTTQRGHSPHL